MQCIDSVDGRYVLSRSYVDERVIDFEKKNASMRLHNWKLSTYLNCLANHGFLIERVVEESSYDPGGSRYFPGRELLLGGVGEADQQCGHH